MLVRRDIEELKKSSQVALISGGGSGHEPAHAGLKLHLNSIHTLHC